MLGCSWSRREGSNGYVLKTPDGQGGGGNPGVSRAGRARSGLRPRRHHRGRRRRDRRLVPAGRSDAEPLHRDLWRAGKLPVVLLQIGAASPERASRRPRPAAPHAEAPTLGSADLCFRFDGHGAAEILALLDAAGVRGGGRARCRARRRTARMGTSVYFRRISTATCSSCSPCTTTGDHAVPMDFAEVAPSTRCCGRPWRTSPRASGTSTSASRRAPAGRADELWQALAEPGLPVGAPARGSTAVAAAG